MPDTGAETTKRISTELELDVSKFKKGSEEASESASKLKDEIDDLRDQISKLEKSSDKAGDQIQSSLNKIIPKFLGFAAVTGVMRSAWTATVNQEQALASLNSTLGDSAKKIEDFADKFSNTINLSKNKIIELSSSISNLMSNLIDDQDAIASLSNEIVVQMTRVSDSTGRTIEDISGRYSQLLRGNLGAFRDIGIDTRREVLETTETFKKYAGDKSWDQLTQNQRTQIALIETLTQIDSKFSDTTETTAGKIGKLQARWENFTQSLGAFVSLTTPVLDFFSNVLESATDGMEVLRGLGDGMQYVVVGGAAFVAFSPSIVKGLTTMATGALTASNAFMLLGSSVLWFSLLIASKFKDDQDNVTKVVDKQTESIEDEIEATKELDDARKGLMGIDEISTLSGSQISLGDDGTEDLTKQSDWVNDYLSSLGDLQESLDETTKKTEEEMKASTRLMSAIMGAVGAYSSMQLILKVITALKEKKRLATLKEALADKEAQMAEQAKNQTEASGIPTTNASAAADRQAASAAQQDATAQLGAAAGHAAKNTAASFGTWAAIGLPLIAGIIGGITAYASTVKMARGGVVNQSTYAEIGEGVYHEAVVPLGNSPEWNDTKKDLAEYLADNMRSNEGQTVTTIVEIEGREVVRATSEQLHDDWKRRGWL